MNNGKKRLIKIACWVLGALLVTGFVIYKRTPGVPKQKTGADGVTVRYLSLPNGEYTGGSVLGFLNGTGTFTFDTGEIYEGQWQYHEMSGQGTLTSSEGVYEGEYVRSMRSGTGTFLWKDGSKYFGQWEADKLCGKGEVTTASQLSYKGTFQDNMLYEGKVSGIYNGNSFEVAVENGKIADQISVIFADGVTYFGDFIGPYFAGTGKMTFPGVGTYEGKFELDQRSGYGVFTWEDGTEYDGEWIADVYHGYGTYTFSDGTSITGTFQNGGLDGTYTYKNSDGEFKTVWENGKCTSIEAK